METEEEHPRLSARSENDQGLANETGVAAVFRAAVEAATRTDFRAITSGMSRPASVHFDTHSADPRPRFFFASGAEAFSTSCRRRLAVDPRSVMNSEPLSESTPKQRQLRLNFRQAPRFRSSPKAPATRSNPRECRSGSACARAPFRRNCPNAKPGSPR